MDMAKAKKAAIFIGVVWLALLAISAISMVVNYYSNNALSNTLIKAFSYIPRNKGVASPASGEPYVSDTGVVVLNKYAG